MHKIYLNFSLMEVFFFFFGRVEVDPTIRQNHLKKKLHWIMHKITEEKQSINV